MAKGSLTLRTTKGSALTYGELDENFVYLNGLVTDLNNALYRSNLTIAECDNFPPQSAFKADVKPGYAWRSKYACTSSYPWWTGSNGVGILSSETYSTLDATALGSLAHGWYNSATALYSHAEGESTLASGKGSHSEGYYTTASGKYSHAEGFDSMTGILGYPATVNAAQVGVYFPGRIITIVGNDYTSLFQPDTYIFYSNPTNPILFGFQSILGSNTNGSITNPVTYITSSTYIGATFSQNSTVVASLSSPRAGTTFVGGFYSHVEGSLNNAANYSSHAEGSNTLSVGYASHTEGIATVTFGDFSHAEGYYTQTTGLNAHAEGYYTIAKGDSSHAEGFYTTASRQYSHTEGEFTTTGYFTYSGVITSVSANHNQDIIQINSSYGDLTTIFPPNSTLIYAYGTSNNDFPYLTTITGSNYDNINTYITASVNALIPASVFITNPDYPELGQYEVGGKASHAEGVGTRAAGIDVHSEGANTKAFGWYSHAEGADTKTLVIGSHAEGISTITKGAYSHAEGNSSLAQGYASHTEGVSTITGKNATYAHAEGDSTQALGYGSHAEGYSTIARRQWSHAEGYFTETGMDYQHVTGRYNRLNNTSDYFVVGAGTSAARFDAFTVSNTKIDANLVFNVMTAAVAPVTGVRRGSIYFDTNTNQFLGWNGTTWVVLG